MNEYTDQHAAHIRENRLKRIASDEAALADLKTKLKNVSMKDFNDTCYECGQPLDRTFLDKWRAARQARRSLRCQINHIQRDIDWLKLMLEPIK